MVFTHKLVNDPVYRDQHLEDLRATTSAAATIVQLGGSDVPSCVQAARIVEPYCDGIGEGLPSLPHLKTSNLAPHKRPQLRMSSRNSHKTRLWIGTSKQIPVAFVD